MFNDRFRGYSIQYNLLTETFSILFLLAQLNGRDKDTKEQEDLCSFGLLNRHWMNWTFLFLDFPFFNSAYPSPTGRLEEKPDIFWYFFLLCFASFREICTFFYFSISFVFHHCCFLSLFYRDILQREAPSIWRLLIFLFLLPISDFKSIKQILPSSLVSFKEGEKLYVFKVYTDHQPIDLALRMKGRGKEMQQNGLTDQHLPFKEIQQSDE